MLESVGGEVAEAGGFGVTVDSSDAALFMWFFVAIGKGEGNKCWCCCGLGIGELWL
ncbi:hypothetical protein AHAS_Ahas04G0074300 [Arachis hypogaea]